MQVMVDTDRWVQMNLTVQDLEWKMTKLEEQLRLISEQMNAPVPRGYTTPELEQCSCGCYCAPKCDPDRYKTLAEL